MLMGNMRHIKDTSSTILQCQENSCIATEVCSVYMNHSTAFYLRLLPIKTNFAKSTLNSGRA